MVLSILKRRAKTSESRTSFPLGKLEPMETDRQALEQLVLKIVSERLGCPSHEFTLDHTFVELGFDSMDAFDMLFFLEETYGLSICDEDAQRLHSLASLVDILDKELNTGA